MERAPDQNTKSIIIIGGGFAGISAARTLNRKRRLLTQAGYRVRLIDHRNCQIFTPSLYEVATKEVPSSSICLPYRQILGQKFDYIIDEVQSINPSSKTVTTKDASEPFSYDFLILATGAKTNYFGIPGLKENAISFKKITDAKNVRDSIDTAFAKNNNHGKIWVVVGGGGFSGAELAAELMRYRARLAAKYHSSPERMEVLLIEGSDRLLNGLQEAESKLALQRLETLGVKVFLESPIAKVTNKYVEINNGDRFDFDVLVWTGGVTPNIIKSDNPLPTDKHGKVLADQHLRIKGLPDIYIAGDIAGLESPTGEALPMMAEIAEKSGKQAAQNILKSINKLSLDKYHITWTGYIVPLSGKYSILRLYGKSLKGRPAWLIQQFVYLKYLFKVLPLRYAVMKWGRFEESLFSDDKN